MDNDSSEVTVACMVSQSELHHLQIQTYIIRDYPWVLKLMSMAYQKSLWLSQVCRLYRVNRDASMGCTNNKVRKITTSLVKVFVSASRAYIIPNRINPGVRVVGVRCGHAAPPAGSLWIPV